MADVKPKVEGAERHSGRRKPRSTYTKKKEFKSSVAEIESDTFNCGDTKYAAKFNKSKENIANYLQCTVTYGGPDIGQIVREMKSFTVMPPPDPDPDDRIAFEKWRLNIRWVDKQMEQINENTKCAFAVVYNQCSSAMKMELKGSTGIKAVLASQDVVELLKLIQSICTEWGGQRHNIMSVVQAKRKVDLFYQQGNQTNNNYAEELLSLISVVESHGGGYSFEPSIIKTVVKEQGIDYNLATRAKIETAAETAKVQYLACLVLNGSDNGQYKQLKDELHNQFMMGRYNYPKKIEQSIKLLKNYQTTKIRGYKPQYGKEEHMAFIKNDKMRNTKSQKGKKKGGVFQMQRDGALH